MASHFLQDFMSLHPSSAIREDFQKSPSAAALPAAPWCTHSMSHSFVSALFASKAFLLLGWVRPAKGERALPNCRSNYLRNHHF